MKLAQAPPLLLVVAVLFAFACRSGAGPPWPQGIARPTATPDTSKSVDAATATAKLTAVDPRLGAVIRAVSGGDVAGTLALVDWQPRVCNGQSNIYCPGTPAGDTAGVVDVGSAVYFYVTEAALRPTLDMLLRGEPLQVRFASRSKSQPNIFYLGFEARSPKGKGIAPVSDPDLSLTGVLLTVGTKAGQPIVRMDPGINSQFHATDVGSALGLADQEIITFEPGTAAAPPPPSATTTMTRSTPGPGFTPTPVP